MSNIGPIQIDGDLVLSLAATVALHINNNTEPFEYYCNIKEKENLNKCLKANRKTLLHDYIESICMDGITYLLCKHFDREEIIEMKQWMDSLNIDYSDIQEPDEECDYEKIEEYADALQKRFGDMALPKISNAVFPILYNDKDFLFKFNSRITEQIKKLKKEDYPDYLQGDGYLNRENPPTWLKKGVFKRDLGRCQGCGTDLSRIFSNANNENYDHIIPLRQGGSNDPTNYQLMCEHCNKSKQDRSSSYRNVIWPYWDDE